MLKHSRSNEGFTLTELMIAIAINTLLFGALITIFIANINHYRKAVNMNRLNQQLVSVVDLMAAEIRRAGYWSNAANDVGTNGNTNPFVASGVDVSVNGSNNCILFAYDRDSDGTLPAVSSGIDDERYGFRLNGTAIQARPPGAAFDCAAAASAWENITDTHVIQITNLTFTLTTRSISAGTGTQAIQLRSVDISVTGRLASDTSITKTLTQHVRIRNDKYIP